MSLGRFDRTLPLPSSGNFTVQGPFDPEANVDKALIIFQIVQGEGASTVLVDGAGTWTKGNSEWSGEASPDGAHPDGSAGQLQRGRARGIALAVVIKPGQLFDNNTRFDPPAIETLTWCADFTFE